jgi:hypothetical protein
MKKEETLSKMDEFMMKADKSIIPPERIANIQSAIAVGIRYLVQEK